MKDLPFKDATFWPFFRGNIYKSKNVEDDETPLTGSEPKAEPELDRDRGHKGRAKQCDTEFKITCFVLCVITVF